MPSPIVLISGAAGSGKDTVAGFLAQQHNAICIAQADPMKRFALAVFGFTEDQLWGPSGARNAPDDRYAQPDAWTTAARAVRSKGLEWAAEALDIATRSDEAQNAYSALWKWFTDMAADHGFARRDGGGLGEMRFGLDIDVVLGARLSGDKPRAKRILTPRYMLQTIGTEWGRQFSGTLWNDYAIRMAKKLLGGRYSYDRVIGEVVDPGAAGPGAIIITDGRFRNEIMGVKMVGGKAILVYNPAPAEDNKSVEAAGKAGHRSEAELSGMPSHFFDLMVENNKSKGLLALQNVCVTVGNNLFPKSSVLSTNFVR